MKAASAVEAAATMGLSASVEAVPAAELSASVEVAAATVAVAAVEVSAAIAAIESASHIRDRNNRDHSSRSLGVRNSRDTRARRR